MNDAIKTDLHLQGCAWVHDNSPETGDSIGDGMDVSNGFDLVFDVSTSLKHIKCFIVVYSLPVD
jgi:hypothetical protein